MQWAKAEGQTSSSSLGLAWLWNEVQKREIRNKIQQKNIYILILNPFISHFSVYWEKEKRESYTTIDKSKPNKHIYMHHLSLSQVTPY